MAGLDKVKEQILSEARVLADEKLRDATDEANEMIQAAKDEAEKTGAELKQKSDEEVKKYDEKVASSCDMKKRTKLLETKQELINDLFEKALDKLDNMNDADYFAFLLKVLENRLKPEEGILFFSEKDLSRLKSDFSEQAIKLAKTKGGSISISDKAANIKNGFIVTYGSIEENCTIEALFNDKKDDLRDILHKLLFS
ncbi:MAG: V-type ATP synthase subunit E [Suipraeoptans sp.]